MGSTQQDKLKSKADNIQMEMTKVMELKIEKSREAITFDYELEVRGLRNRIFNSLNIPNVVDYSFKTEEE